MSNKALVTIARQTGVGGSDIGKKLGEMLDLPYYDNKAMAEKFPDIRYFKYLQEAGEHMPADREYGADIGGYSVSLSMNEDMFGKQRRVTLELADEGKGGVFVSRCADDILAKYDNLVRVFLKADLKVRVKNIMEREDLDKAEAEQFIAKMDNSRDIFYNYYTDKEWGNRENYDLVLDVTKLTVDQIAAIIKAYVDIKNS